MTYEMSRMGHILLGALAVLFFWLALTAVKGGNRHRAAGKLFFSLLLVVAITVGPILLLRPGEFDPGRVVQFVYLALCMATVTMVAWTAIAWKGDLDRFRGRAFKVMAAVILILGLVVLAAGIAQGSLLTMLFSWVGLTYGTAMLRFAWLRGPVHPRWSLIWHLNGVAGLFNAAHGTLLAQGWRMWVDPAAGEEIALATQLLTMAIALGMRIHYGAERGAPMRLAAPRDRLVTDR